MGLHNWQQENWKEINVSTPYVVHFKLVAFEINPLPLTQPPVIFAAAVSPAKILEQT